MGSEKPSDEERDVGLSFLAGLHDAPDSVKEVLFEVVENTDDALLEAARGNYTHCESLQALEDETGFSSTTLYRVRDELAERFDEEDFEYRRGEFEFGGNLLLFARAGKRTAEWAEEQSS